jgi:formate hydrogenlyase transcriptional activator
LPQIDTPPHDAAGSVSLSPHALATLLRIHRVVGSEQHHRTVLAAVAQVVSETLGTDELAVLLSAGGRRTVEMYPPASETDERGAQAALAPLLDSVVEARERARLDVPAALRERFPASADHLAARGLRSALVVPLVSHGQALGALALFSRSANAWTETSPAFVDELAASVAGALAACLSREDLESRGREAAVLLEVNRAIGRHLNRDELFGALARCLRDVVPTQRFGIELPIEGDRLQGHLLTPRGQGHEPTLPTVLPAEGTVCDWVLRNVDWVVTAGREELRETFPVTFAVMAGEGLESLCALPLVTGERCGAVLFFMAEERGAYTQLRRDFLEQMASAVAAALDDCLAHEEVARLRDRLAAENVYLQEEIRQQHGFEGIVGESPALRRMLADVEVVAPTPSTVLLVGETGTGKELVARAIHERSGRRERPLVKVNCAAISAGLVESELFGHVKGAFTGAVTNRVGRFELAHGGTLFLDEVGELPLDTQVKLLRVLQERAFEPVGSSRTQQVDVRLIAATNRDLRRAVEEGRFRSDLFFRLNVLPLTVPPLRERREDIPLLVHTFAQRVARDMGKHIDGVSARTLRNLAAYAWPGNVRELQNYVERAVVLASGPVIEAGDELAVSGAPPPAAHDAAAPGADSDALDDVLRRHMLAALTQAGWVIDGPRGAARVLGLSPSTLRSRMRRLGIERAP